jgi:cell division protein FtsX
MVMIITLVILAMLFLLFGITSSSLKTIQDKVDVSVYLKNGLAEPRILEIQSDIEKHPLVTEVSYVSSLAALEQFKETNKDKPNMLAALNELSENPFPATLHVKTKELSDFPTIAQELQNEKYKVIKINSTSAR